MLASAKPTANHAANARFCLARTLSPQFDVVSPPVLAPRPASSPLLGLAAPSQPLRHCIDTTDPLPLRTWAVGHGCARLVPELRQLATKTLYSNTIRHPSGTCGNNVTGFTTTATWWQELLRERLSSLQRAYGRSNSLLQSSCATSGSFATAGRRARPLHKIHILTRSGLERGRERTRWQTIWQRS